MKKICVLINNAVIRANHVWADSRKKVAGVAAVVTAAMIMAFCAPTGSLEDIVNKVGTLAFGVLELVGAILLVLGWIGATPTTLGTTFFGGL